MNWVNGLMSWGTEPDNTNSSKITQSPALDHTSTRRRGRIHCPLTDRAFLSSRQRQAGWNQRAQGSYSMNAMELATQAWPGLRGIMSTSLTTNNDFKTAEVLNPADIFVFLDEHPASIDDGYFLSSRLV